MQQALQRAVHFRHKVRLRLCTKHMLMRVFVPCLQKQEELERLQAELHSLLAGVTAARHEQQQQQRLLAQLHHQHEDFTRVMHYRLLHCCVPQCPCYTVIFLYVTGALLHASLLSHWCIPPRRCPIAAPSLNSSLHCGITFNKQWRCVCLSRDICCFGTTAAERFALLVVKYCCWQAERAVQDHVSQLQEELRGLKDAKHHHAEQQCEQVGAPLPMTMHVFTILISSFSALSS